MVTPVITGYCEAEENPLGPVHAYVTPEIVLAVRLRSFPTQTGVLLLAEGATGVGLTATLVVPAALVGHPPTVTVTE